MKRANTQSIAQAFERLQAAIGNFGRVLIVAIGYAVEMRRQRLTEARHCWRIWDMRDWASWLADLVLGR